MRERLPVLIMKTKSCFELYTPTNKPTEAKKRDTYLLIYTEENPKPKYSESSISNKVSRFSFVAREIIIIIIIEHELCTRVSCRCGTFPRSFVRLCRCLYPRSSLSSTDYILSSIPPITAASLPSQPPHSDHFLPSIGI